MRAKLSDIRAGRTLYSVSIFPYRNGCPANIEVLRVTERPHKRKAGLFFRVMGHHFPVSCGDRHIGPEQNDYNHHYAFTTRKSAERYIRRIQSGCLTHAECKLSIRLRERDEEDAYLFPHYSSNLLDTVSHNLAPGLMPNRAVINISKSC